MSDAHSIERPSVALRLQNAPSKTMLCEMDIHAYDWPPGDPKFEINAAAQQFMAISEGHRETIMFLMHDFASVQSAWADGKDFWDRSGNWAFFEARITALD